MDFVVTVPMANFWDTFENGLRDIDAWASVVDWRVQFEANDAPFAADYPASCTFHERHSKLPYTVTGGAWRAALRRMAMSFPELFALVLAGSCGGAIGNVMIQLAAFGELRYGIDGRSSDEDVYHAFARALGEPTNLDILSERRRDVHLEELRHQHARLWMARTN